MSENKQCSSSSCDKKSCEGCSSAKKNTIPKEELNAYSAIKKVVGVVSGKGGVGKSFVTASLANEMAAKGYRVGILDADITGPSIPRMYGLKGAAMADDNGIYPMLTENDIKIMSINLLLPQEDSPVIWRGPVIASAVKQFWEEVDWGDVDCMFVDCPPGTGDVPLTIFQSLPVDGIVVVTSPQELVSMIVDKAVKMAQMMDIPVLGIVENMSYFKCPDCGNVHYIYGKSHVDEKAAEHGIDTVAKLPMDPQVAAKVDAGCAEDLDVSELSAIAQKIEDIQK